MLKSRKQITSSYRWRLPNAWQGPLQRQQVLRPGKGGANILLSLISIGTRKLKNQIYNCSCLQGVQRPRKRDFEKCMGRVRKTPLSRVSVKTLNYQIKVTPLHNVHFGYYVFLPTEQAETNICWIIYQDATFEICLSLFGWKVNILTKRTLCNGVLQKNPQYWAHNVYRLIKA